MGVVSVDEYNIKTDLTTIILCEYGLDATGSRHGPTTDSCKHNEN